MNSSTANKQIIFVDSSVQNYQNLIEGADANAKIVILDDKRSGIEQITQALASESGIEAVHVVSHGNQGSLKLGADVLNGNDLEKFNTQLKQWGNALTENGDILLYGCDAAATETGNNFVKRLSELTGADVAASNDLTGSAAKGGDWDLEIVTGQIESAVPFNRQAMEDYDYTLATFNVTEATDDGTGTVAGTLSKAILDANTTLEDDTITLTTNVRFTQTPNQLIDSNIAFIGGGFTVSGDANNSGSNDAGDVRPFFVKSGTVSFTKMTIRGGRAQGGDGSGGGAGMGGGLFIYDGTVSLNSVTFSNNSAIGGNGGIGNTGGGANFVPLNPANNGANQTGSNGFGGGPGGNGGEGFGGNGGEGFGGNGGEGFGGRGGRGGEGFGGNGGNGFGGGGGFGGNGGFGYGGPGGEGGGGGGFGYGGNGGFGGGGGFGQGGPGGFGYGPGGNGYGGFGGFGGGGGGGGGGAVGADFDGEVVGGFGGGYGGFGGYGGGNGEVAVGNGGNGYGGGAGMGGAVFIRQGTLMLDSTTFIGNTATGGTGNVKGQGKGGAIFAMRSLKNTNRNNQGMPTKLPTVTSLGTTFTGNTAVDQAGPPGANTPIGGVGSDQDNNDVYGTIAAAPTPAIAVTTPEITPTTLLAGTTKQKLYEIDLAVTTLNAQLTGVTLTPIGTYTTPDISGFKLIYSTDNILDGGDTTLATQIPVASGSPLNFTGLTQTINTGTTGYLFLTSDIATGATQGNTITIDEPTLSNFTFAAGNKTGTPTAGGRHKFDGIPTITSVTVPANNTYGIGGNLDFTATFSEPVTITPGTGSANLPITLDTGGTVNAILTSSGASSTTQTFRYTAASGNLDSNGITVGANLALTGDATIQDATKNNATLTLNGVAATTGVLVDGVAPTVTINQATGQTDPTSTSPINYTVTFSEPVTGFDAADIDLSGTAGATTATVTGSGANYNVAVSGMTAVGSAIGIVKAGGVTDIAGNTNTASTSTDNIVTYDNIAPTVTIDRATEQTDPTATSPINYTVTFSEPVTGFDAADIDLTASTAAGTLIPTIRGSGTVYSVEVNGMTGGGNVIASIKANGVTDTAGNNNTASTSTDNTVAYNNTFPTVTSINRLATSPTAAATATYEIKFSEDVTGVDVSDFTLVPNGVTGASIGTLTPVDAKTYQLQVNTGTGSGKIGLNLVDDDSIKNSLGVALGGATAGNGNLTGQVYDIDKTPPTGSLNAVADVTTAGGTSQTLTVTFSDNNVLDVSSLDSSDVLINWSGGAIPATFVSVDNNSNGTPRTATYSFVPPGGSWDNTDNGTYTVNLQGSQVKDALGNLAVAGSLGTFNVNVAAPVATTPPSGTAGTPTGTAGTPTGTAGTPTGTAGTPTGTAGTPTGTAGTPTGTAGTPTGTAGTPTGTAG
ncbi:DUF4347 domain-containing protein, partial [Microcoleus sp. B7-D4]